MMRMKPYYLFCVFLPLLLWLSYYAEQWELQQELQELQKENENKEEVKYVLRFINKGVKFVNREYKNGKWVDLKPLVKQMTPKKNDSEVQKKINRTININRNQKVKPGYKKKLNKEIEKI